MDGFCGETFWNTTLLVDSSWPQFTPCFVDLVVTCIPCCFFWLTVPCHVYITEASYDKQHYPLPVSRLSAAKLICCCLLCLLAVLRLVEHAARAEFPATVTGDGVLLITTCAATAMTQYERTRCMITSSVLFIFWLLKSFCDIVPCYTKIMEEVYAEDVEQFTVFLLSFVLSVSLMVMYSFADPVAVFYNKKTSGGSEKSCPETRASFLNQLTFAWLTKLVILSFKRPIEMTDLWNLNPRDQSTRLVPEFERIWAEEEKKCFRINKKQAVVKYGKTVHRAGHPGRHHSHDDDTNNDVFTERTSLLRGSSVRSANCPSTFDRQPSTSTSNGYGIAQDGRNQDRTYSDNLISDEVDISLQVDGRPLTSSGKNEYVRPSLVRVLLRQFGGQMAVCLMQRLVSDIIFILCPQVLGLLIYQLNHRDDGRVWPGYVLSLALLLLGVTRTVFYASGNYRAYYTGLQLKSVLIGAIFNKSLRLNNAAKKKATSGEIVNLMSVDAQRLQEFISRIFFGFTIPFIFTGVLIIIYFYVDEAVFASILILCILVPVVSVAGAFQKNVQERLLVHKDSRLKIFNEIMNGIKVLKLYAWEPSFERRVASARGQEIRCLVIMATLYVVIDICTNMMSFLITLASFGWYILSQTDHFLDPSAAFVIMSQLNILSPILGTMGMTLSFFVQAKVSVKRINDFLCSEELDLSSVTKVHNTGTAIHIEKATFAWDDPAVPILENIDLHVPTGQLVAVVGVVGAGKSSLISTMLGEMVKVQGKVALQGNVSYVPQQAWIQNCSLRDNVLLGQTFQADRYRNVLRACQLQHDLDILPAGDLTEIGEKGTNLSGGQKQRVSLARAVYSDRDVYLMDDPLSAVDSHVGKAIFSEVIGPNGLLKNKTRVLVTHGVHWLPLVDKIVVMRQGRISEMGTYSQLMRHNGDFAQFLKTFLTETLSENEEDDENTDSEVLEMRKKIWADVESATEGTTSGDEWILRSLSKRKRKETYKRRKKVVEHPDLKPDTTEDEQGMDDQGKLITSERLVKGKVPLSVYLHHPRAAGAIGLLLAFFCFGSFRATSVASNFWLRQWTEDAVLVNQSTWGSEVFVNTNHHYLLLYGVFGIGQVVLLLAFNALYWTRTIKASRRLHNAMVHYLFRAPMAFFDTTPIGRIMNRVSTDVEIVDSLMPLILRELVSNLTSLVSIALVLVIVSPASIVIVLTHALCCYLLLSSYVPMSRQCRRMEAVTRSPIFAHFSETISGATTIRAYGATDRFIAESKARVDRNQTFYFTWLSGLRWIQMSLDACSSLVVFFAALMEVVSTDSSGGSVGLAVSYALQLQYTTVYLMRQITDFETNVVSVERIKEYSEIHSEAPWSRPSTKPVSDWPSKGQVELRNFQIRYRPGLDLVLKGLTCTIRSGEKIGIVGRTGAGKSSFSLALFRLIEAAGGAIFIDGVNIADLGLHDLRSRLTILPQDPVLFSGTLRFNLDPFGEHADRALWGALQQAHLQQFVQGVAGHLDYHCGDEGSNLSVGQRQLVCLARTLLRRTRLLVLDEATAAVDMETDALIQATVKEAFSTCTVLTIAHRLHTIIDYDRILVLDEGRIQEFDTAENLMSRPDSAFAAMLKDAKLT